jgi:hypothetical protein
LKLNYLEDFENRAEHAETALATQAMSHQNERRNHQRTKEKMEALKKENINLKIRIAALETGQIADLMGLAPPSKETKNYVETRRKRSKLLNEDTESLKSFIKNENNVM